MLSRRVALAVVVGATAFALSGCEAPNPAATVFSGSSSANREALCWSSEPDRAFDSSDCLINDKDLDGEGKALAELVDYLAIIEVVPEDTIGISVDPEVAETGWSVTLNGKPLSSELITTTYYRFSLAERAFRQGPIEMRIFAATEDGELTRGYWVYQLSLARSGQA
jgi:hypothetical protein